MTTPLIDIDTYKIAKSLTSAKDDERLSFLVTSVSQLVKTYCNNSLVDYVTDPYVEYIDVEWDTTEIQLTESPVLEILEVKMRLSQELDLEVLDPSNYRYSKRTDTLKLLSGNWPIGVESVEVTYRAGYERLPADLKLAVIDLIAYYYKEEYKNSKTTSGSSLNNVTTSSLDGNVGFPDHIKRVLDLYRQL